MRVNVGTIGLAWAAAACVADAGLFDMPPLDSEEATAGPGPGSLDRPRPDLPQSAVAIVTPARRLSELLGLYSEDPDVRLRRETERREMTRAIYAAVDLSPPAETVPPRSPEDRLTRGFYEGVLRLAASRLEANALRGSLPPLDPRSRLEMSLETDRPAYRLGEPITLRYVVRYPDKVREGDAALARPLPFAPGVSPLRIPPVAREAFVAFGGDHRAGRPVRFKVLTIGPNGSPAADPKPQCVFFGGVAMRTGLGPGDRHVVEVDLHDFCSIDRPGRYRVRVYHDLGFAAPNGAWHIPVASLNNYPPFRPHVAPVVETSFEVSMPTPAERGEIIDRLIGPPTEVPTDWNSRHEAAEAVRSLTAPDYFEPLLDRVRRGRWECLRPLVGLGDHGRLAVISFAASDASGPLKSEAEHVAGITARPLPARRPPIEINVRRGLRADRRRHDSAASPPRETASDL